jgi:methylthioribose-1-phosphate isomerase
MRTIYREGVVVKLVDQTRLPHELTLIDCASHDVLCAAIRRMQIRGAPALGVAAAYAMALGAQAAPDDRDAFIAHLDVVADEIRATRPTAVNLFRGVEAAARCARDSIGAGAADARSSLWTLADDLADQDVQINHRIGDFGTPLIPQGGHILTHCNAGALATIGWGTALGVVRTAHADGKQVHVFATETRPFLQGARLTAWELAQEGIPYTLITDNMVGYLMAQGEIDVCVVGADRIAACGDVANKIGTYTLAVLAQAHGVPFYVAAPTSTIDPSIETGGEIPIEERDPAEVLSIAGVRVAPEGAIARHPAFDVTPCHLVSAIITELGVLRPPFEPALIDAFHAGQTAQPNAGGRRADPR